MTKTCKKCLLTTQVQGVTLDEHGVCNFCRDWEREGKGDRQEARQRVLRQQDLEQTLRNSTSSSEYDCILSFSGGKDSCYLLYKLVKEYKLRVLAYTSDFDIPPNTWDNIRRTIKHLNVDHYVATPSQELYRRFIRHLLRNQNQHGAVHTVCYFWLDIREGDILRLAMEKNIPLIITGYSPGQPDPERMLYEMPEQRIREDWTPYELFDQGLFEESEKSLFWNPNIYGQNAKFPRIIAPFHAWDYNQEEVMERVVELGLAKNRWYVNPVLSNFTLNWLLIYSDLKNLGYNPYKPEFSQLIREGKARRSLWLILFALMDFMARNKILLGRYVTSSLQWLDLQPEQLRIKETEKAKSQYEKVSI
jgi:tRNA(Ile)-lysidine synthase TilS/MesJ